jgi:hypothetical protein
MCHVVVDWDESFKELIGRVIEEHKEILDALADDGKAEYEAECTAAQSQAQAEDEAEWQAEQDDERDRLAAEHNGPEGDE